MDAALARKLGWRPGMAAVADGVPDGFACGWPAGVGPADAVLVFVRDSAAMGRAAAAATTYRVGDRLWVAYPKKSGRLHADIDRDRGWEALAALGLLPVTQVALDADWSALRWRRRSEIANLTRKGAAQPS